MLGTALPEKTSLLPTEDDIAYYQKNGWWKSGQIFSEEDLEKMKTAMYQVYASDFVTGKEPHGGPWIYDPKQKFAVRKIDQSHWTNPTLAQVVVNPTVGQIAAMLADTKEIRLWHDQLLFKPGQKHADGESMGKVGWHQDYHYWQCASECEMLTGWVAFDDVTIENGCMQVIPGSHKWGLLPGSDFFSQDENSMKNKIEEMGHKWNPVPVELKAGEVSFHHCLTVHGSGPNFTDRPRRSIVLHLQPEDCVFKPGTECDAHQNGQRMIELGRKAGEPFSGDIWHTLWKA